MKIKIKIGETYEMTREESLKFFEMDADSLDLIQNGQKRGILHCLTADCIQSAVIPKNFNISNIDEWVEDDYKDCKDVLEIVGENYLLGGYYDDRIFEGEYFEGKTPFNSNVDIYTVEEALKLGFVENVIESYNENNDNDNDWESLTEKEKAHEIQEYTLMDDIAGLTHYETKEEAEKKLDEIKKELEELEIDIERGTIIYGGMEQNSEGTYQEVYALDDFEEMEEVEEEEEEEEEEEKEKIKKLLDLYEKEELEEELEQFFNARNAEIKEDGFYIWTSTGGKFLDLQELEEFENWLKTRYPYNHI